MFFSRPVNNVSVYNSIEVASKRPYNQKKNSIDSIIGSSFNNHSRQVAERLKAGQPVQPETYECVTLFFSDVVSFTTLASRCTPLQVLRI